MPTPLVVNGATFNYPVNFDTGWGIDATGWAQAVTAGMLQKAGGSFPLTSDVDFGAAFGLKAAYFETRSINPATTGTFRLASADSAGIAFRNNANTGNLLITTDASDDLLYNGSIIAVSAGGPISVSRGGTGDGSLTAYSVLCGGTTSLNPVQSVSGVGLIGQVLASNGAGMLPTWQNVSGTGTVNSGTAGQIGYYATTSSAISPLPALSYSAPILQFTAGVAQSNLQIVSQGIHAALLQIQGNGLTNQIATASIGDLTITDIDNARTVLNYTRSSALVTIPLTLSMSSHNINNVLDPVGAQDAATKNYVDTTIATVENTSTSTTYVTNGVAVNVASISLTPGRWMISGIGSAIINGSTWSSVLLGISTTSASFAGVTIGQNGANSTWANSSTTPTFITQSIPSYIQTVGVTTTYYLVSEANFTAGNPAAQGCRITAVRIGF